MSFTAVEVRQAILKSLLVAMALASIVALSMANGKELFVVSGPHPQSASRSQEMNTLARQILRDAQAAGLIDVTDVSSGRQIAYAGVTATGKDDPSLAVNALVPPLSVIKVFLATEWLDRGFANARSTALRAGTRQSECVRTRC